MLNMSQINDIKEMLKAGYPVAKIALELHLDEKTVRKYRQQEDFSPKPPEIKSNPSKLDGYKPLINQWLTEDKQHWHKQQHTAKRVHHRLEELYPEQYRCSYNLVQRYVKQQRSLEQSRRGTLELQWEPGYAQVDFGEADFLQWGELLRMKYLEVSFPYSNDGYTQVFGGETAECVCQGLKDVFEYIGGVPGVIIFDNATGVGRKIGDVIRETELFLRFRAHNGFTARFCNPYSGHEKGHVEAKVRYDRNNLFVPVPVIEAIEPFNAELLKRHEIKARELHYKKRIPIHQLFEEDRKALLALPRWPFDACRYLSVKTDGYGNIRLDGQHYYSTRPEYAYREVWVALRAHTVDILDEARQVVVSHPRKFGSQRSDIKDFRTSMNMLLRNAGAWKNSGIRQLVPETLRDVMDTQSRADLQKTLRTMHRLSQDYDFETALQALEEGLRIHHTNFCDAAVLAARMTGYGLTTPPEAGPDLRPYDQLLEERDPLC